MGTTLLFQMLALVAALLAGGCAPTIEPHPTPRSEAPAVAPGTGGAALEPARQGPSVQPAAAPKSTAPHQPAPVMRSIRQPVVAGPFPVEFSGACYPVWFATNRKPADPTDPTKGFTSEFDEQIHYGKRVVYIPASHRPGELGSPLWKRLLSGKDDRLSLGPAKQLAEESFAREIRTFLAGHGKVHIIAHSMGNRGLLRAMHRATTQAALRAGVRFGQIFLAAPDVDAKLFRQLASVYPQIAERTTLYVADQDKALAALEWLSRGEKAGGAPPVIVMPGIDTIRVRGSGLFRLGHSCIAEEIDVLRDIRALLYWKEPPERRRARNGWPVPDRTALGSGAWTIGE